LLTQDPIGLAGGVNLYAYAANNPVAYSDPFGLCEPFCTAIDVAMVTADVADIAVNGMTVGRGLTLAVDVVAAAIPFVPALAGATARVVEGAQRAEGVVHNNSLRTTAPAQGYSLRDKSTGSVLKYGETTQGTRRYTQKYLRENNAEMVFEAKGSKQEMHDWQHQKITEHKAANGGSRPPLNKSDY